MSDRRFALTSLLLALAFASTAVAQEGTPIIFLPPPMDGAGTLSLGIFNGAGKLIRTLHREAGVEDFKAGENGLITRWDGRDDAAQPVQPGKYGVRGWMTGDLGVEGVAFHGNDWIKEESPRFTRVVSVKGVGRDEVQVTLSTADGKEETLGWKLAREGEPPPKNEVTTGIEDGKLIIRREGESAPVLFGEGESPVACVSGSRGRVWAIVQTPDGREVRAYSEDGEFLRRLPYEKDEPQPVQIAASQWSEMIFLLDENATEQRLRSLALGTSDQQPAASTQAAAKSAWRVTYLKRIIKSDTFDAIAARLGRAKPPKAEAVVKLQLRANPLLGDAKAEASVKVAVEAEGVVLKTSDDLPLVRLTTAHNLKWAALVKEGAALTLFQGDGCVVEEFKIAHPGNLMSFDAGDIEIRPPGSKPRKPDLTPKRSKALRPGDDL
jgi:hypothetical protein